MSCNNCGHNSHYMKRVKWMILAKNINMRFVNIVDVMIAQNNYAKNERVYL